MVIGGGPLIGALDELPAGPFDGVVLANELLDNLPFRLLQRSAPGWDEVLVGSDLAEVLVQAQPDVATEAERLAPDAAAGGRIPLQRQAANLEGLGKKESGSTQCSRLRKAIAVVSY